MSRTRRVGWPVAAALVVLVVTGALLWWHRPAEQPRVAAGPLPAPAPPVTDPMTPPPGSDVGWSWINPIPRAMPAWLAVASAGPAHLALVGRRGQAARLLNGSVYPWQTQTDATLFGVAWLGGHDAVAVGEGGTIRILDGAGAETVDAGTRETLHSVVALDEDTALVVGDDGTLLRVVDRADGGLQVHTEHVPTKADLMDVTVRPDGTAVAVGTGGVILRIGPNAADVKLEPSGTGVTLRAVGGCAGSLYAAGDDGRILLRSADGWHALASTGQEPWSDIACDHGRSVVVGRLGGVRLLAGMDSVALDSGSKAPLYAVSGSHDSMTWIVGDGGRLAVLGRDHVRWRTAGPYASIFGLSDIGGSLVAVGPSGKILRQRDRRMYEVDGPTEATLVAVAPLSERRLLAVGDAGTLVEITPKHARLLDSPSRASWRGLVTASGEALVVGADGTLLRGTPGAWTLSHVAGTPTLWGVTGTPDDAVAVGDEGAVVHIDGASTKPVCTGLHASLRAVARLAAGTWAVGKDGVIVKVAAGRCTVEHSGGPDLHAVGLGPDGFPIAVGADGTVLERASTDNWAPMELDADEVELRAVLTTKREVYVAGSGGVILRYPRLE